MLPRPLFNVFLVLALAIIMADCFYYGARNVSAGRSNPPNLWASCFNDGTRHLFYQRSASSASALHSTDQGEAPALSPQRQPPGCVS